MWDPPPRYPPLDVNSRARLRPIAYLSYERYAVGVPHGAPYNSPFLGETKKRGARSVRSAEEKSQAGGGMTVRSIGWADSIDMADKMSTSMMSSADGPENNGS
ncbi:hypothetical protein BHM03_00043173 [Ensete ventricosum]|nr:hypothetical protein BHM03_00043173 [Ensete ventricosum]